MATHLPMHRLVLIVYNAMVLAVMATIMSITGALWYPRSPLVWFILIIPLLTIVWSVVDIEPKARVMGYWGLGMMLPIIAVLGVFGGWGILYAVGVFVLLWTAWVENEGKK